MAGAGQVAPVKGACLLPFFRLAAPSSHFKPQWPLVILWSQVVIASKITGGRNINARSIIKDCEDSLARLGTDYMDVYNLHWPARYSPQSNWGQSLEYKQVRETECSRMQL